MLLCYPHWRCSKRLSSHAFQDTRSFDHSYARNDPFRNLEVNLDAEIFWSVPVHDRVLDACHEDEWQIYILLEALTHVRLTLDYF